MHPSDKFTTKNQKQNNYMNQGQILGQIGTNTKGVDQIRSKWPTTRRNPKPNQKRQRERERNRYAERHKRRRRRRRKRRVWAERRLHTFHPSTLPLPTQPFSFSSLPLLLSPLFVVVVAVVVVVDAYQNYTNIFTATGWTHLPHEPSIFSLCTISFFFTSAPHFSFYFQFSPTHPTCVCSFCHNICMCNMRPRLQHLIVFYQLC